MEEIITIDLNDEEWAELVFWCFFFPKELLITFTNFQSGTFLLERNQQSQHLRENLAIWLTSEAWKG